MKTKTLFTGFLLSSVFLIAGPISHAEETTQTGSASVEITSGSDIIIPDPIQPSPPTGPMLPVKDIGISSATDLHFDSISLTSKTVIRDALYIRSDGTPISNLMNDGSSLADIPQDGSTYVPGYSVTDRRGTGAGWSLTLTLGGFVEQNVPAGNTARTLKGVQLTFPKVAPITTSEVSDDLAPITASQTFDAGGSAKVLMSATKDQGMGLWEARYNSRQVALTDGTTTAKQPIQLSVPGNNYAGKYKATLTWNLADAPTGTEAE